MTACGHRAGTGPASLWPPAGHSRRCSGDQVSSSTTIISLPSWRRPWDPDSPSLDNFHMFSPHCTGSIYWSLGNKLLRTRGKYGSLSHFLYNLSRKICRDFRHFGIIKADVAGERLRGQLSIRETKKMLILFHLVNTTKQITLQRNKSL